MEEIKFSAIAKDSKGSEGMTGSGSGELNYGDRRSKKEEDTRKSRARAKSPSIGSSIVAITRDITAPLFSFTHVLRVHLLNNSHLFLLLCNSVLKTHPAYLGTEKKRS